MFILLSYLMMDFIPLLSWLSTSKSSRVTSHRIVIRIFMDKCVDIPPTKMYAMMVILWCLNECENGEIGVYLAEGRVCAMFKR